MSVNVDLAELAEHLAAYRFGYLLTVGDTLRVKAVAVTPALDGGVLVVEGLGPCTRANLVARPDISLVWPPVEEGGYTLILDGHAEATETGAHVTPGHAVL
ncbi:MAG: hypothetical protein WBQ50_17305, partial [Nocardioides sp.]